MRRVTTAERRRRLASRHHLAERGPSVEEIARDLIGFHASDPASVYLGALARFPGLTVPKMEDALYGRRSLLKILGMRRTMFVVPTELGATIDAAVTRALSATQHRLLEALVQRHQVSSDPRAWISSASERVLDDLRVNGEATTRELSRRVPGLAGRVTLGENSAWATEVGLASRLLFLLAVDGKVIRARPLGSWLSSQYRWAALDSWLPETVEPADVATARTDLVTRWLRGYGPGTIEDLAWWTGLPKREVRTALAMTGAVEVQLEDRTGWLMSDDLDEAPAGPEPWVALLPALDSTTMGWRQRGWYLDPAMTSRLFDVNGNAGPTVWASGRVVGGWGQRPDGSVATGLLARVDAVTESLIDVEARRLTEWFAGTVATPRFRAPLERELAAGSTPTDPR